MSLVNLAGAVVVAAASSAAPAAQQQVPDAKVEQQQTVKVRNDGDTTRPPRSEEEQARAAYEAYLERVTKSYAGLPDEEDRRPEQPRRDGDAPKSAERHY